MLQIASISNVALKRKAGFSAYSNGLTENNQSPVVTASAVPVAAARTRKGPRIGRSRPRDENLDAERLPKPNWIRVKAASSTGRFGDIKNIVRSHQLVTVCEEASCPNIGECWSKGTATFMIMGDKCTRRCRFCNVSTGRPDPLDGDEPQRLAQTIALMKLNYVVITSVDRDDLRDGGASHFVACIRQIRALSPYTRIEILTPDFGGRLDIALEFLSAAAPDVLNHNIETVPRLYKEARPGAGRRASQRQVSMVRHLPDGLWWVHHRVCDRAAFLPQSVPRTRPP